MSLTGVRTLEVVKKNDGPVGKAAVREGGRGGLGEGRRQSRASRGTDDELERRKREGADGSSFLPNCPNRLAPHSMERMEWPGRAEDEVGSQRTVRAGCRCAVQAVNSGKMRLTQGPPGAVRPDLGGGARAGGTSNEGLISANEMGTASRLFPLHPDPRTHAQPTGTSQAHSTAERSDGPR